MNTYKDLRSEGYEVTYQPENLVVLIESAEEFLFYPRRFKTVEDVHESLHYSLLNPATGKYQMMVAARHEVEDDVVPYVLINKETYEKLNTLYGQHIQAINEMSRTSYEYKQILGI